MKKTVPSLMFLMGVACAHRHEIKSAAEPLVESVTVQPKKRCYSGLVIVADDGRIEMQGCPEHWEVYSPMVRGNADPDGFNGAVGRWLVKEKNPSPNRLLEGPDDNGRYYFPGELEQDEPYITLVNGTPHYHCVGKGSCTWTSQPLFPAYAVNHWISDERKVLPFFLPEDGGPMIKQDYAHGEIVEGRPFHMLSCKEQMEKMFIFIDLEKWEDTR